MASKNRPGSAKRAMGVQEAQLRRGAPGKRFIGETSRQSARARQAEREKVERMAEVDDARHRAEALGIPISAVVAELVQDAARLVRTLVLAPFRIAYALRRPARAG